MRIEAAKNLLRTTALKSYEVAERVGINDPVYFSRIFKKITGLKPKDYRHSVPHNEYMESANKAKAVMDAIERASEVDG